MTVIHCSWLLWKINKCVIHCPHLHKIISGDGYKGGERGGSLSPPFSEMPWGPPFESFAFAFALVFEKPFNHSRHTFNKHCNKSYVCQNKAHIRCKHAKTGLSTTWMCRQRTIENQMTSNNLQCEMYFHAEANSQTIWKNLMWFQQIKFLYSMCSI